MKNDNSAAVKNSPKEVFWHLGSVITLYIAVISVLTLAFQYINYFVQDNLNPFYGEDYIRWAIAALVVVYPLHILLAYYLQHEYKRYPIKREGRLRKWLLYFTLFVAAVVLAIDTISLIYHFLEGEVTLRFFLKVIVVGLVSGGVFWYYLWDLKHKPNGISQATKNILYGVSVAVLCIIIGGVLIAGSPQHQRLVQYDNQRISDLQSIQNEIVYTYWQSKGSLPGSLDDLRNSISGFAPPMDPVTQMPYEYRVTATTSFELCATFDTDSATANQGRGVPAYPGMYGNFDHPAGYACFSRNIDPSLYPPKKAVPTP